MTIGATINVNNPSTATADCIVDGSIELCGPVPRVRSIAVAGPEVLPVRMLPR